MYRNVAAGFDVFVRVDKKVIMSKIVSEGVSNAGTALMGFDLYIQVGDRTIGHVDTARTIWSGCYRIQILNESQWVFVIALPIICDSVSEQETD